MRNRTDGAAVTTDFHLFDDRSFKYYHKISILGILVSPALLIIDIFSFINHYTQIPPDTRIM